MRLRLALLAVLWTKLFAFLSTQARANFVVINAGQSTVQGLHSGSALDTTQPYGNTMITSMATDIGGTATPAYVTSVAAPGWPTTPLIETNSIQSPRSGMANYYASVSGGSMHIVPDIEGGTAYVGLKKGTTPFLYMQIGIEGAWSQAKEVCRYIVVQHGEGDHELLTSRATYKANLKEWRDDIQAACRTGGRAPDDLILFITQFSSWTATLLTNHGPTSLIPGAVYDAARTWPDAVRIVQPAYPESHEGNGDGVHYSSAAERKLGARAGEAMLAGTTWQPLWPQCLEFPNQCTTSPVTRVGAIITLQLYVPVTPLVLGGCGAITGVSSSTMGFEYTDSAGAGTISSVSAGACIGHICPVTITLSADPSAHIAKLLRYAWTGTDNQHGGPTTGPRGDVCDSQTITWQGATLTNHLVHFEESVP